MIRFTFLSENKTDNPACMAEHGLSIYIETEARKILFDTGASDLLIRNAKSVNVELSTVETVVISHGHYDHTEGVPAFLEVNQRAKIYIHKNAFQEFHGMENGQVGKEVCGILWSDTLKKKVLERAVLTEGFTEIYQDIYVSGTIPDVEDIKPPERFFAKTFVNGKEEWIEDDLSHEQFLAVRQRDEQGQNKGIYLFSGCSHKGVVPAINYARELFKGEKILGFIAGMHLYCADDETREKTVKAILDADIEKVVPVHCTGIRAICDLKAAMGENCIVATAGDTYVYR